MTSHSFKNKISPLLTRLEPAKKWFDSLSASEQKAVSLLAAVFVVFLLVTLMVKPVYSSWQDSKQRYLRNAQTLLWIEQNAAVIEKQGTSVSDASYTGELVVLATESASANNLVISSVTPEGDDRLQVSMRSQPFTAVLKWLHGLEQQGVHITRVDFSESGEGAVDVRGTIER